MICVCWNFSFPGWRFSAFSGLYQKTFSCLRPWLPPLVNTSVISQFWANVHSFKFLTNALTTYGKYWEDELLSKFKFTSQIQKGWILFLMFITKTVWRVKPEKIEEEEWDYLSVKILRFVKIFKSSWEMTPTRWSYSKWLGRLLTKFQKHWLPLLQQLLVKLCSILPWRSWTLSPAIMKRLTQDYSYTS